jgi:hypothetical protein
MTRAPEMLQDLANRIEALVPIRLDIELDNIKIRDTFTWNLSGKRHGYLSLKRKPIL